MLDRGLSQVRWQRRMLATVGPKLSQPDGVRSNLGRACPSSATNVDRLRSNFGPLANVMSVWQNLARLGRIWPTLVLNWPNLAQTCSIRQAHQQDECALSRGRPARQHNLMCTIARWSLGLVRVDAAVTQVLLRTSLTGPPHRRRPVHENGEMRTIAVFW